MLYAFCFAAAVVVGLAAGRIFIPLLRALKAGQTIREIGPKWHQSKSGTPTMGGVIFILPCLLCLLFGIGAFGSGDRTHLILFLFALVFGVIGFADDYVKVRLHRNLGLTAVQKLLLQLAAAAGFLLFLRLTGALSFSLYIPFWKTRIDIPWPLYLLFAVFVIVGCVNAVNLTDGIDGLAAGVTLPVMLFYTVTALRLGKTGSALFAIALAGGLAAFLVFNFHPAKVFMGDTGSLFLGGAVCGLAFALDMPLVLVGVGIIYIAEAMSDILQVGWFKLSHGKRIFRMAPLHHHFELGGWSEIRIFCVFTGITVAACVLMLFGVL